MIGDIHFEKVGLLLHFGTGTDNSSSTANPPSDFKDHSKNNLRPISAESMRLRTSTSEFGGGSAEVFDYSYPTGLLYPSVPDLNFGLGDGTVELSVKLSGGYGTFIPIIGGNSAGGLRIGSYCDGTTHQVGILDGSSNVSLPGPALSTSAFTKVMVSRKEGVFYILHAGVLKATVTGYASYPWDATNGFRVGSPAAERAYGFYSEVRVTKGVARATASYTPDTTAFPNFAAQFLGNVKDSAGSNAARLIRAYKESDGSFAGETTSDATTGNYTLNSFTLDACTLVFTPAGGEALNNLVLRGVVPG